MHNHCHKRRQWKWRAEGRFLCWSTEEQCFHCCMKHQVHLSKMPNTLSYIRVIVMFAFPHDYIALYYSKFYFGEYISLPWQCNELQQWLKTRQIYILQVFFFFFRSEIWALLSYSLAGSPQGLTRLKLKCWNVILSGGLCWEELASKTI